MILAKATQEFEIRYYHWATSEFEKEIAESFPILRTFKSGPIWEAYQFMQQIDKNQQLTLAKSLLKRTHSEAANILGERLSDEDNSLLNKFDNFRSQFHVLPVGIELSGQKIKYVSKNKLRKAMEIAFTKAYGNLCVKILTIDDGYDPFFEMKFAGWIVTTFFSFGRHQSMIYYSHSIRSETKIPIQEYPPECWPPAMRLEHNGRHLSLPSGLGLAGQAQWVSLKKEDVDQACDVVIKCCGRFFEVAPKLLKGLEFEKINRVLPH